MESYERKEDCRKVEGFIWGKIMMSCGYFEGIWKLSNSDLEVLKNLCEKELRAKNNLEEKEHCNYLD